MAEKPASERTEEATPERLKKAREEGRLPQSQELPSALLIGTLLICLALSGPGLYGWFAGEMRDGLTMRAAGSLGPQAVLSAMRSKAGQALAVSVPFFLAAAAASVLASLVGSGWTISPKAARVRLDRISPAEGFKRLFSSRSVVLLVVSLVKLAVLVTIVWTYLRDRIGDLLALRWTEPEATVAAIARFVLGLLVRLTLAIVAIAGFDVLYQRRKYKKDLRMTRQEIKEERRQYELSPELKGRIRSIQIEMVRKRMLQEVPTADVVLANPTHVAVALRYDRQSMDAPQVVAKGGDLMAEKIKEIARAHGVPIVHRPELARTIFTVVEVGQPIPEVLFVAVAEVLAMIHRLRRQRAGT